ncbi:hypothetical protein HPC49_20455 [Pyxidicoccus fallax]|uniref:Uncharacterized protein n=1 Tax=Pyxidicoccus fallax TaxID=394095 RepID=A0A848LFZ5_9BACT|nr:hypothetical protein [Pyxidicoccus fallax]NMO15321.1 hypothetical protein [Pyxidicoccus fallax]NPC80585.1 hypothetical protein [Pyxidicoccus fallax]
MRKDDVDVVDIRFGTGRPKPDAAGSTIRKGGHGGGVMTVCNHKKDDDFQQQCPGGLGGKLLPKLEDLLTRKGLQIPQGSNPSVPAGSLHTLLERLTQAKPLGANVEVELGGKWKPIKNGGGHSDTLSKGPDVAPGTQADFAPVLTSRPPVTLPGLGGRPFPGRPIPRDLPIPRGGIDRPGHKPGKPTSDTINVSTTGGPKPRIPSGIEGRPGIGIKKPTLE